MTAPTKKQHYALRGCISRPLYMARMTGTQLIRQTNLELLKNSEKHRASGSFLVGNHTGLRTNQMTNFTQRRWPQHSLIQKEFGKENKKFVT